MELIRNKWVLLLAGVGLVALTVIALIVLLFTSLQWAFKYGQPPAQPVAFSHVPHVQAAGIQCTFCHRGAETGAVAGVPSLEQCMFCHRVIGKNSPEVQKVAVAYQENRPIDWVRVHRLPDSVHFNHEPHLRASLTCAVCHGDVGAMVRVKQVRSLEMGDCLDCHKTAGGPTECSVCHY